MSVAAPLTYRLKAGSRVPGRELPLVAGGVVHVPTSRLTHLQFRRFAGCPVCSLHVQTFARRHAEIVEAGVDEVIVFHSSATELLEHVRGLPFGVVADPGRQLYREFGVEYSPRAAYGPRAWPMMARAFTSSLVGLLRGTAKPPRLRPDGGRFGLPADFLIGSDGAVIASKYGAHVDDHWSVEDLLELADRVRRNRPR